MRQEYIVTNGARLWTSTQGEGPGVVLLHGGPGLWDYLEPVADILEDRMTVHRYEQRGCGRSSSIPPFNVGAMVVDLERLRRQWNHSNWFVLGHSWGADLGLAYALAFPDRVKGLVYVSGTGLDLEWKDIYRTTQRLRLTPEQWLELGKLRSKMTRAGESITEETDSAYCRLLWSSDFADRRRAPQLINSLVRAGRRPNYEVNREILEDWRRLILEGEMKKQARDLKVPVLIMHGEEDPRPSQIANRLGEILKGAQIVLLPKVGHYPWLEDPKAFGSDSSSARMDRVSWVAVMSFTLIRPMARRTACSTVPERFSNWRFPFAVTVNMVRRRSAGSDSRCTRTRSSSRCRTPVRVLG
jgi:proline iminopeptidase